MSINTIVKSNQNVYVMFSAEWCHPCAPIKSAFQKQSNLKSNCKFLLVNIDDNPDDCIEYNITSVPTVLYFNNGILVDRFNNSSISSFERFMNSH